VRPRQAVFNTVFEYEDPDAREPALPGLHDAYARVGVHAWSVAPPDVDAAAVLQDSGFRAASTTTRMAAYLRLSDLEPRARLGLIARPGWQVVARRNDRACGVLARWGIGSLFESLHDERREVSSVCRARGRRAGRGARLDRHPRAGWRLLPVVPGDRSRSARRRDRDRAGKTRAAPGTGARVRNRLGRGDPAAAALYRKLGARPLGRLQLWERLAPSASSTSSETRRGPS
jgi:hypothetical protein